MKVRRLSRVVIPLLLFMAQAPLAAMAGMNLRVDSISIVGNPANAGGTTQFVATVTNTGDMVTAAFVKVFLSSDAVITTFDDQMLRFDQSPVLSPGQSATVSQTVTLPDKMASGDYFLGTIVDGWYDDVNGGDNVAVAGITVIGSSCLPDDYEQDDTFAAALPIQVNDIQMRNHCDDPNDWMSFQAVAGTSYGIQSAAIGYNVVYLSLELFAADGTLLASTPIPQGENPKIVWTAPGSGTYYVRSRPVMQWIDTGIGTEYSFVIANHLPDLVMPFSDTQVLRETSGGTSWFYTAVANYGFTDSGPFDIGVYLSPDPVVTRQDMRIGYRHIENLAANRISNIGNAQIAFPGDLPAGTYYIAAIADDIDNVAEYEEDNNQSEVAQVFMSGPSCTPDAYEEDDLREMARPITLNEQQDHNFCEDGFDWLYFDAIAGQTLYLRSAYLPAYPWGTITPAGSMELYALNGGMLAHGEGIIGWTAPQTGRYYALVRGGLSASTYSFALLDQQPDLAAIPYWSMETITVPRGGVIDDATYAVRNVGFVDSPASTLGFYFSPDSTITPTDQLLRTVPVPSIAPSALVSQTFVRVPVPLSQPAGTYQLGTIADVGNTVVEFDEGNNGTAIRELLVVEPPCAPDSYDDDDLPGQAKSLALNEVQSRNFCEDGYDWVSVDLQVGMTYAFETDAVGNYTRSLRPVLYDAAGSTVLAQGETDNYGSQGWASITAPASGRYYVLATNLDTLTNRTSWGEYMNYTLQFSSCQPDAFEQDDADPSAGKAINVGDSQSRNHCDDGVDWAVLTLGAPGNYTISTGSLGSIADTLIEIYTTTSTTPLASNDNLSVNNKASSVTYNFSSAGTYFIKVVGKQRGAGTDYTLSVQPAKGRK